MATPFRSVVLDVDSTLCGIEGIDWLAERRDKSVADRVAAETARAMRGELALEAVYASRLDLVKPSRREIELLASMYESTLASRAEIVIGGWLSDGTVVALLTSGIRQAILPLALEIGIPENRVHAVDVFFDIEGDYVDFDRTSPLSVATGKREILKSLNLPRPIVTVGDGSTDLATRAVADAFVAFTGYASRETVVRNADMVAATFDELDVIVRNGR